MFLLYLILTILFLGFGLMLYHAPDDILSKYAINSIWTNAFGIIMILIGVWFAISTLSAKISNQLIVNMKKTPPVQSK